MRKVLPFLIVLFMLVSISIVWAGKAEKIRIIHYHWTQPPYDEINVGAAKSFMAKYPNVEVKVLLYPDPDLPTKVRTAIAAGGDIDTFAMWNGQSGWFMGNGLCAEIIPSAFGKKTVQEVVNMWEKGAIKKTGGFYNGKYYGIPHEMSNYVAWINTAHMKEAGLDPKTDIPKTWEEFVDVCKKMTVRKGGVIVRNGFAINLKASVFPFLVLHSLMEQKGLDWSTEKGLLASLDTKEALEAFTTFTNFATKDGIFDPGLFDDEREGFGNGLCSTFLTGGTWYWGVLDHYSVPRKDVTPMKYPRFKDGEDIGGPVYGYCVFVAKQCKHKEWAWKWLNWLESQPEAYIVHGYYQPRKTLDPSLVDKYVPNNDIFGYERKHGAALLSSPKFNEIQDAVGEAIRRVVFRGMSNKEALRFLKEELESILE
ncbi:MAG: hypothetical protein DRP84_10690 [Spirochaetes bacterium]|uniref:Extracellular solute-binding protein n=1 Tax=Aerophobetes bacterium TaxID=2030807 RepID=A0A7V0N0E5_UNCAE|nr:MAG: hypothetical protein DRP84_10690 [Spirochaetota bacterium]HDN85369.1 extracellular solute-binding protein [Candidatus Aerophobetes bacterium]